MTQKAPRHSLVQAGSALVALFTVVSAHAEVPAVYSVASNQTALVTVRITTTNSSGSQFDEDSMVVPVTGNGTLGLFPEARPFTFAEMKAGSTLNFGGGTLNFQLLCGFFGCIPVTVNLSPTTTTLVASAGAAIVGSGGRTSVPLGTCAAPTRPPRRFLRHRARSTPHPLRRLEAHSPSMRPASSAHN